MILGSRPGRQVPGRTDPLMERNDLSSAAPRRILILNQSFWPDVVATAQYAHDLARNLRSRGHDVTVIASRSLYGQPGTALKRHEVVDGITVYRVSSNIFSKRGIAARSVDFLAFNVACLVKAVTLPKHDVVIALTTPPFIAVIGILLRLFKGSRFVFWTMDLYPDLPLAAGVIRRTSFVYRIFDRLDRLCLRRADRVIALGRCMQERLLAKGVNPDRLRLIAPWADPDEVPAGDAARTDRLRQEWGIGDRFVIQYSGNFGIGHDLETVCKAMLLLKDDPGLLWLFVGGGVMWPAIQQFVAQHGISNVLFKPYQPRSRLGELIRVGDLHLVLMSPEFEGVILPSKFYGVLAAGRPAVFVGPRGSEVARVIAEEQCGFTVPNGDPEGLVDAISRIRDDRPSALAMGAAGRSALERRFSMLEACREWNAVLEELFQPTALPPRSRDRPLRILVISQYFPPDVTAAAYRIGDTVRLLKERGHVVRVITATPHKGGLDHAGQSGIDASDIRRITVNPLSGQGTGDYLSQYIRFAIGALRAAVGMRRTFDYDVVWATSPPLFMAICTIPLRLIARRPVVLDIRDLWPESAVGVGKIRRGSLSERIGKVLEWAAYRWSDGLTCVSQPMRSYIAARTRRAVTVVYNGTPEAQLAHHDPVQPKPDAYCYAGNLGYAQGLDGVIEAFAQAHEAGGMGEATLHLVGTGSVEAQLRELAQSRGIDRRVIFHGVKPKQEALRIMADSGVLMIPLLDSPAFELTVPSKVFDCMGLGRPIIASIRGEGRQILESTGANIVVAPGDTPALRDAFLAMHRDWNRFKAAAPGNVTTVATSFSREAAVAVLSGALAAEVSPRR